MSRYIDADAFEVFGYTTQEGTFDDGVQFVLEKIDAMPTADVVEVVRCKDCTRQLICYHSDDYYCADGERREDAEAVNTKN